MVRHQILAVLILNFLFSTHFATAAELQLSDIVSLGLRRSPVQKKNDSDLTYAREQTKEYKAAVFPTIYADFSYTANEGATAASSSGTAMGPAQSQWLGLGPELYKGYLGLSQPLYVGGLISAGIELRNQMEDAQRLQNLSNTQNLVLNIVTAYYGVVQQMHLLRAAKENVILLNDYDTITKRYEKIGRARRIDRMIADANLLMAQTDQNTQDSLLVGQREQLRQLLAVDTLPALAVENDLGITTVEKIDANQAVAISMKTNPDILVLEKQRDEIENNEAVDVSQDLPSLYLTGQVGYMSPDRFEIVDSDAYYSQVMLELKIPMFTGLSSIYKRRSYEAQKLSASRTVETTQLSTESTLRASLYELQASFERLQVARQADVIARNALEIGMRDFQRSLVSTQDVLTLQSTRYTAEKLFITTHFSYLTTLANTRKLMGISMEEIYGGHGGAKL